MKHAAPLAAALLLAAAAPAGAQTPPDPTGPYLILETSPDVLSVLATGSRARTGGEATLTWILLKNPPGGDGTARTDIGLVIDCAKKAMQQRTFATRGLDGAVKQSGAHPKAEWMPLKGGRSDQAMLNLACDGTVDGEIKTDLDKVAADWRATRWD